MASHDAERWDTRYADRDPVDSGEAPTAVLAANLPIELPTAGRGLDVACGLGAQSLWMADRGLEVVSLDVSSAAIERLTASAQTHHADRIDARVVDLDDQLDVDLNGFDLIVCQRFWAPHLYDAFVDRLGVGGISVVTVLSTVGAGQPGEFHAPAGELTRAFDRTNVDVLYNSEADGESSIILRRIA